MTRMAWLGVALSAWLAGAGLAGPSPADQRLLSAFDREFTSLDRNRAKLASMNKTMLKRQLDGLAKSLEQVSTEGKAGEDWKSRRTRLDELLRAATGAAGPADAAAGPAQPSAADQGILRNFERDMGQVEGAYRASPKADRVLPQLQKLRALLATVSEPGRAGPAYAAAAKRLDEFEAKVKALAAAEADATRQLEAARAAAEADLAARKAEAEARRLEAARAATGAAPATGRAETAPVPRAGPAEFTYPDLQALERFDSACNTWPLDTYKLRKLGPEGGEAMLADLTARLDAMRPELQQLPKIVDRRARLVAFRARFEEVVLGKLAEPVAGPDDVPPTPGAKGQLAALTQSLAARGAGMAEPSRLGTHLDALRVLDELRRTLSLAEGQQGEAPCLELRRAAWQVARFEQRLEKAFGGFLDRPSDQDQTLMKDLRHRVYMARRDQGFGPLELQDPARRKLVLDTLAGLEQALAAVPGKRTRDWLELERDIASWKSRVTELVAASEELAKQAPDLDGQLKLIQEQFPKGRFAPAPPDTDDPVAIRAWAARLANWKAAVPGFAAFFEKAKATSLQARAPEFAGYASWFAGEVGPSIEAAARDFGSGYRSRLELALTEAAQAESKAESSAGAMEGSLERMQAGLDAAARLAAFEEGFRGKVPQDLRDKIARIEKAKVDLSGGYEAARAARRLPAPLGRDPELEAKARDLLAKAGVVRGLRMRGAPKAYKGWVVRGDWMYLEAWESFTVVFAIQQAPGKWLVEWADLVRDLSGKGSSDWRLNAPPYGVGHEILEANIDEP